MFRIDLQVSVTALALALSAVGCTDSSLLCTSAGCHPAAPPAPLDNKVEVQGQACTADPNSIGFPYKILFIIDVSGSTGPSTGSAGSDPTGGRGRAVQQVLSTYGSNPVVSYAILTFDTQPNLVEPTFTNNVPLLQSLVPQVNLHLMYTNYDDTLLAASRIIAQDANAMSPTERARTRYDVEFLSDGTPTDSGTDCQTQASVLANENQLLISARALGVMSIHLSTVFLTGPDVDVGRCDAAPTDTLQAMATLGGGTYQALDGNDLRFSINYTSIVQPFTRNEFYVVNESRVVHNGQLLADSDNDGVSDVDEAAQGTDPTVADTFKTGCGDRMTQLYPDNPNLCTDVCAAAMAVTGSVGSLVDSDADGLLDCVEIAQSSSKDKADTDGDNLVDKLEMRFGTNPIDAGTLTADTDLDGVLDADEVFEGTDPLTPESDRSLAYKYTPLTHVASNSPSISCFQFDVSNIQLVQTLATANSQAGDNRICLYVEQLPQNSSSDFSEVTLSRHCFTANYQVNNGQAVKIPANGLINLTSADFTPLICGSQPCASAP